MTLAVKQLIFLLIILLFFPLLYLCAYYGIDAIYVSSHSSGSYHKAREIIIGISVSIVSFIFVFSSVSRGRRIFFPEFMVLLLNILSMIMGCIMMMIF